MPPSGMRRHIRASLAQDETLVEDPHDDARLRLVLPLTYPRRGGATSVTPASVAGPRPDARLIRALRMAHAMLDRDPAGQPVLDAAPTSPYRRRLVRLAFLAPALQAAILSGRQAPELTLAHLTSAEIPLCWEDQMRRFGPVMP